MEVNFALVLQGGAMKSMFTTGVLDAFLDEGLIFPYIVGVSAGATNGIAFLAREKGHTCRVNLTYMQDPRFMSIKNYRKKGSYFNFDFLYDELPHHIEPFNYDALFQAKEEIEIGATNCETGEVDYFSFQEARRTQQFKAFLKALYASCSVPCVCKPVFLNNIPYLDGGIGDPIPYARAWEQGYENQVVVLTQPLKKKSSSRIRSLPPRWVYRNTYPVIVALCNHHSDIYNQAVEELTTERDQNRFLVITPDHTFGVRGAEKNRKKLIRLYFHGYDKGLEHAKILKTKQ